MYIKNIFAFVILRTCFKKEEGTVFIIIYNGQDQIQSVSVRIAEGDTIYSLFAATPSPLPMAFTERLSKFYELNPHLQLQTLVPGELIQLPIYAKTSEICSK